MYFTIFNCWQFQVSSFGAVFSSHCLQNFSFKYNFSWCSLAFLYPRTISFCHFQSLSVCNSIASSFEQSSCCCPLSPALIVWNMNMKLQGESLLFPGSILNCYYIRDYLAVEPQITVFWQSSCVSNERTLSMSPCIHLNHLFPSHISLWKWNIHVIFSILPNHGWIRNTGTVKQSILFEFMKYRNIDLLLSE